MKFWDLIYHYLHLRLLLDDTQLSIDQWKTTLFSADASGCVLRDAAKHANRSQPKGWSEQCKPFHESCAQNMHSPVPALLRTLKCLPDIQNHTLGGDCSPKL